MDSEWELATYKSERMKKERWHHYDTTHIAAVPHAKYKTSLTRSRIEYLIPNDRIMMLD